MKKYLLSLSTLCVLFTAAFMLPSTAKAETYSGDCGAYGSNLTWSLNTDTGALVINGTGPMADYEYYPYTDNYAPWIDHYDSLRSLTLGNGVTSIGAAAFAGCSFSTGSLIIPDSVTTIGWHAFYECSGFTGSLTLPDSVTRIGDGAFQGCGFTGSLTLPNNMTMIGEEAFRGCSGFTGILSIPDSVIEIGPHAFQDCGFTGSLTIPENVTWIGYRAFTDCDGFTGRLTIGSSVELIGAGAFQGCSGFTEALFLGDAPIVTEASRDDPSFPPALQLKYFESKSGWTTPTWNEYACTPAVATIIRGNCGDGGRPNLTWELNTGTGELHISGSGIMSSHEGSQGDSVPWAQYRDQIRSLTLDYGITSIGGYAFSDCVNLTGRLNIPNSVTRIGEHAFSYCRSFTGSLIIPNSVTSIGWHAFYQCSGFTGSLTIPNSVTTIGWHAFRGCSGFTGSLTIGSSVILIDDFAFCGCNFTGSLTIPGSVEMIGWASFQDCSGFTGRLTIGGGVTEIGADAFRDCTGFTEAYFEGNAPSVAQAGVNYSSFQPELQLFYNKNNNGWTSPTWNEYACMPLGDLDFGDLNADGTVSVGDAILMCRYIANPDDLSDLVRHYADVNGDDKVDMLDMLLICKYIAGIVDQLPG